jgi:hypothetical protein
MWGIERNAYVSSSVRAFKGGVMELDDQLEEKIAIPSGFLTSLPSHEEPVNTFIQFKIPPITHSSVGQRIEDNWSTKQPNWDPLELQSDIIVDGSSTLLLLQQSIQAIWDGMKSIKAPDNSGYLLPLWFVSLWSEYDQMRAAQSGWIKAKQWLVAKSLDCQETCDASRRCLDILDILPWKADVKTDSGLFITSTAKLALIISGKMLTTFIVDYMMAYIRHTIPQKQQLSLKFFVQDTCFMREILRIRGFESTPLHSRLLDQTRRLILQGNYDILIFPVHIEELKHFVAMKVDFRQRLIFYGKLASPYMQDTNSIYYSRFSGSPQISKA